MKKIKIIPHQILEIVRLFLNKEFWKYYLLMLVGAVVIVLSEFDWNYFVFVNSYFNKYILFLTDGFGFLIPILFIIFVLFYSWFFKNHETRKLHLQKLYILVSSIIVGFLSSTFIKIFAGRESPPHFHGIIDTTQIINWVNNSHNFQMGILREQIFGGFPSSHTTVFFALAFTIYFLYPKKYFLHFISFATAFFIGLGVTLGWHWFSEFYAGIILGYVVAKIVTK